jgi:hypothetical protein
MSDIKKFCLTTGISLRTFFKIIKKFRNKNIWFYDDKNKIWKIKNFIIENYDWEMSN